MADTLAFDILARDRASGAFRSTAAAASDLSRRLDLTALSSKGVTEALSKQGRVSDLTAAQSSALARVLRLTGDEEDRLAAKALLADAAVKRLGESMRKTATAGGGGGFLSKLLPGLFGAIPTAGLAATPGAAAGGGQAAGLLAAGGPVGIIGGVAAAIAASIAGVGGIVPALAAAGLGMASFGALAIPTITKVTGAISALSKDTAAYQAAVGDVAKDKALAKIRADWAALTPAQRQVVRGVQAIQAEWGKMAAVVAPVVSKILSVGVQIADKLLPAILPFAQAAGNAILGLLRQFDKFASSAGFRSFLSAMLKLAGPAITVIGKGIGEVAASIGLLLQRMVTPQGLLILGGIFKGIAGTVTLLGLAFEGLSKSFFILGPVILGFVQSTVQGLKIFGDVVLTVFGGTIHLMRILADAVGIHALDGVDNGLRRIRGAFDRTFNHIDGLINGWKTSLENAPRIFKLKGDITDLQAKLARAEVVLNNPDLTKARKARIEADISNLSAQLAKAKAELAALQGTTVVIPVSAVAAGGRGPGHPLSSTGRAAGGWASGWTTVGERGRELLFTPPGSYVYNHAQTEAILSRRGSSPAMALPRRSGGTTVVLEVRAGSNAAYSSFLAGEIKKYVHAKGGGDVQVAFGRTA